MRAARSIIWSVSTNSRPMARATSRPTEVFPAPMKPMTMMVGWIWRMAASLTAWRAEGRVRWMTARLSSG